MGRGELAAGLDPVVTRILTKPSFFFWSGPGRHAVAQACRLTDTWAGPPPASPTASPTRLFGPHPTVERVPGPRPPDDDLDRFIIAWRGTVTALRLCRGPTCPTALFPGEPRPTGWGGGGQQWSGPATDGLMMCGRTRLDAGRPAPLPTSAPDARCKVGAQHNPPPPPALLDTHREPPVFFPLHKPTGKETSPLSHRKQPYLQTNPCWHRMFLMPEGPTPGRWGRKCSLAEPASRSQLGCEPPRGPLK